MIGLIIILFVLSSPVWLYFITNVISQMNNDRLESKRRLSKRVFEQQQIINRQSVLLADLATKAEAEYTVTNNLFAGTVINDIASTRIAIK